MLLFLNRLRRDKVGATATELGFFAAALEVGVFVGLRALGAI
jgi:Flp pilus assembly pilin Flp